LETLLHEDQVLSIQGLGARDEGWSNRSEGFGYPECLVGREATLEEGGKAMKASCVRVWLVDGVVDG
jgi:hypothetical protein